MIAVIGGSGFLGAAVSRLMMERGVSFKVFDLTAPQFGAPYQEYDVATQADHIQFDGADVLINLAAEHRDDVKPLSKYTDVNVTGAHNVCEVARKANIKKIIFTRTA